MANADPTIACLRQLAFARESHSANADVQRLDFPTSSPRGLGGLLARLSPGSPHVGGRAVATNRTGLALVAVESSGLAFRVCFRLSEKPKTHKPTNPEAAHLARYLQANRNRPKVNPKPTSRSLDFQPFAQTK